MATTRTIGPLHFEDLEPKRFEDLARQLIYEFKAWRRLEATGRSGADDGFDARGYEIRASTERAEPPDGEGAFSEDEAALVAGYDDRLWLVQCKREQAIGPTKLARYVDDIVLTEGERLHGVVFTAACDFSKASRDKFTAKCRALGAQEWHLWGKAELEDRLFRPENDHLLFAYFGVSLTIRRRSQRTDLRARLAMKRKAHRVLGKNSHTFALLRSPDATAYPHSADVPDFKTRPQWLVRRFHGYVYSGLSFVLGRYFAYLGDDGETWDAAFALNDARAWSGDDPWREQNEDEEHQLRAKVFDAWNALPEKNRAWLEYRGLLQYESILDIDELGDEYASGPHIYAPFTADRGPFAGFYRHVETIEPYNARETYLNDDEESRVMQFPEQYRHRTNSLRKK